MTGAIASFSSGKELTGSSQQCPGIWYLDNELICEFRAWDQLLVGVWLADGETPESAIFSGFQALPGRFCCSMTFLFREVHTFSQENSEAGLPALLKFPPAIERPEVMISSEINCWVLPFISSS